MRRAPHDVRGATLDVCTVRERMTTVTKVEVTFLTLSLGYTH